MDKLLVHQSQKIQDPVKQKAFLRAGYQELVNGLSVSHLHIELPCTSTEADNIRCDRWASPDMSECKRRLRITENWEGLFNDSREELVCLCPLGPSLPFHPCLVSLPLVPLTLPGRTHIYLTLFGFYTSHCNFPFSLHLATCFFARIFGATT